MSISINRLSQAWFEFKGVRSDTLDIYMTQMPVREIAARQLTRTKVAGRSGEVRISDNSYDDIAINISFKLLNPARINAVAALLTGSGTLRFSDDPLYDLDAVIETPPTRQSVNYRYDAQTYSVSFVCHPFKKLHTPAANITVTTSGTTATNPGTAPALPRVTITGSGSFNVTIAGMTMFFHDVTTGVIVDSELGDVLNAAGTLLANNNASGELFKVAPGQFMVSWVNGGFDDETETAVAGSVTSVVIEPRWRYF